MVAPGLWLWCLSQGQMVKLTCQCISKLLDVLELCFNSLSRQESGHNPPEHYQEPEAKQPVALMILMISFHNDSCLGRPSLVTRIDKHGLPHGFCILE